MSLSRQRLGRRRWVAAAVMSMALVGPATPAGADFCQSQVIHDYAKPLKRLPALPSPPVDDHLSFAPARVFLSRYSSGSLQLGPGKRGFALSFSPWSEDNSASRRVGWNVLTRLVEIDRRGKALTAPQTIERQVKRVPADDGLDFSFEVPGSPALYRLEIVFENGRGERLARFGENFRVLRPSLDVDFVLNGSSFHRGDEVKAYLVNRGASFLSFGLGQTIQYYDGASWVAPPVAFPGGIVPLIGLGIGPGVKTTCWGTAIPSDAALGTYRFAKTVDHSTGTLFARGAPLEVSAEFSVTE